MLTKITAKNQITLPKAVLAQCSPAEYYEVSAEAGRIMLTPVLVTRMDKVWDKLEALGVTEQDIADAVQWVRTPQEPTAPNPKPEGKAA
ncbi:MAG: AbrB/MazE/SpoVT family DNA-binding domain-containing protein [Burkholderiales bacterium]